MCGHNLPCKISSQVHTYNCIILYCLSAFWSFSFLCHDTPSVTSWLICAWILLRSVKQRRNCIVNIVKVIFLTHSTYCCKKKPYYYIYTCFDHSSVDGLLIMYCFQFQAKSQFSGVSTMCVD